MLRTAVTIEAVVGYVLHALGTHVLSDDTANPNQCAQFGSVVMQVQISTGNGVIGKVYRHAISGICLVCTCSNQDVGNID